MRLLAVFAHPDDESFGVGGTLAKYAAGGARVALICATRGEGGLVGDPPLCRPEELGRLREDELRAACAVLGIRTVRLLGCLDGQVSACANSSLGARLAEAVRELRPQVVLTFGPDGISGHPDHVAVGAATRKAISLAADAGWVPPGVNGISRPWAGARLYYVVRSRATAACCGGPATDSDEAAATARVDVGRHIETKLRAMRCHRSQPQPFTDLPERELRERLRWELFRLAEPARARKIEPESDLF